MVTGKSWSWRSSPACRGRGARTASSAAGVFMIPAGARAAIWRCRGGTPRWCGAVAALVRQLRRAVLGGLPGLRGAPDAAAGPPAGGRCQGDDRRRGGRPPQAQLACGSRSWWACPGGPVTLVWRVCVPATRPRRRGWLRCWTASSLMWPSMWRPGRRGAIARSRRSPPPAAAT